VWYREATYPGVVQGGYIPGWCQTGVTYPGGVRRVTYPGVVQGRHIPGCGTGTAYTRVVGGVYIPGWSEGCTYPGLGGIYQGFERFKPVS